MPKPKIDKVMLGQMVREGKPFEQIAQHFGVTISAVSHAKKKLGNAVAKELQLVEAHKVVQEHLDTVSQLKKINEDALELLNLLMRWNRGDEEALQVLESQVRKVRVGKTEKFVEEFKFKDPRELALHAMSEIRGQLKLQNETLELLCKLEAVSGFQTELMKLLGEIDPEVRNEFIKRLEQRQAVRRAVRLV